MPIKPENKARYPKDWPDISRRIRERAGNKCEQCMVMNGHAILRGTYFDQAVYQYDDGAIHDAGTGRYITHDYLGLDDGDRPAIKIVLTTAHLDHNPENCEDENLKAWCQRCHNRYDLDHRSENRKQTHKQKRLKNQPELNFLP